MVLHLSCAQATLEHRPVSTRHTKYYHLIRRRPANRVVSQSPSTVLKLSLSLGPPVASQMSDRCVSGAPESICLARLNVQQHQSGVADRLRAFRGHSCLRIPISISRKGSRNEESMSLQNDVTLPVQNRVFITPDSDICKKLGRQGCPAAFRVP